VGDQLLFHKTIQYAREAEIQEEAQGGKFKRISRPAWCVTSRSLTMTLCK
jgi:hypothetical protein